MIKQRSNPTTVDRQPEPVEEVKTEAPAEKVDDSSGKILFFGNSLTAGYGLDISEAFPAAIQSAWDPASGCMFQPHRGTYHPFLPQNSEQRSDKTAFSYGLTCSI